MYPHIIFLAQKVRFVPAMSIEMEKRRKQIVYRSNHRGIKEMDIILGGYADTYVASMDEKTLDEFEAIMSHQDRDLLTWFTQEVPVPKEIDTPLFKAILNHTLTKY